MVGGGGVSQIILRHLLAPRLDTCWWCLTTRHLLVMSHNKTLAGVASQQDTFWWCLTTRHLLLVSHIKTFAGTMADYVLPAHQRPYSDWSRCYYVTDSYWCSPPTHGVTSTAPSVISVATNSEPKTKIKAKESSDVGISLVYDASDETSVLE